ncbi:PREDICTED: keratin-associated protein 26-1 [Galeopterus variegatus]|uniref:Keratin-associated protein n=1 Tax=Galeopterus variegatus TaxID=482537 RepID=A0ABM0QYH6_GALVR|nr:PREDICTED: keratin-associated protein 26-1 [Galeopterus variegatus]
MSCHNYCSGNYSSGFLRNSCHIPLIPSISLCSTNVSRGDVLCLPSSSQDCTWLTDNCPETCSEPPSCQPAACEPSNAETSCYSSTAYYVPRPCQGTSFLPASSFISSSCLPISYRPLRYMSGSCRPLSPLLNSCQLLGSVPCDYRPLTYLYNSCRPLSLLTYGCQPSGCLAYGPQTLQVVPSSPRPLQLLYGGCRPLIHAFSTCCPPCPALGCQ